MPACGLPSRSVSSWPTTAASSTAGWRTSVASTSTGETQIPPTLSMSSERPQSEEHTSELQSQSNLVCRLLLEKKKIKNNLQENKHYQYLYQSYMKEL